MRKNVKILLLLFFVAVLVASNLIQTATAQSEVKK